MDLRGAQTRAAQKPNRKGNGLARIKELEAENTRLKCMYADLILAHTALKDAVEKKAYSFTKVQLQALIGNHIQRENGLNEVLEMIYYLGKYPKNYLYYIKLNTKNPKYSI